MCNTVYFQLPLSHDTLEVQVDHLHAPVLFFCSQGRRVIETERQETKTIKVKFAFTYCSINVTRTLSESNSSEPSESEFISMA